MIKIFFYLLCLKFTQCQLRKLEGFILEGAVAEIEDFPHSAYLETYCGKKRTTVCGSSILNQLFILTAAHCLPTSGNCTEQQRFQVSFGNAYQAQGTKIGIMRHVLHENYFEISVQCDIALGLLERPITFGSNIARVALRDIPVRDGEMGAVAGWGYVLLEPKTKSDVLRRVNQTIITRENCKQSIGGFELPAGTFCAQYLSGRSYPTGGDSGSALVVDRYVQVGLVSFKMPKFLNITVYTDVTYFYDWIKSNVVKLLCQSDLELKNQINL